MYNIKNISYLITVLLIGIISFLIFTPIVWAIIMLVLVNVVFYCFMKKSLNPLDQIFVFLYLTVVFGPIFIFDSICREIMCIGILGFVFYSPIISTILLLGYFTYKYRSMKNIPSKLSKYIVLSVPAISIITFFLTIALLKNHG